MGIADGKDSTPFVEGNNNKEDNNGIKKNVEGKDNTSEEKKDVPFSGRRTRNRTVEMPSDNVSSGNKVDETETFEDKQVLEKGRESRSSARGKSKPETPVKQKGKGKDTEVKGKGKDNEVKGKGKDNEVKGKRKVQARRRSRRSKRGKEDEGDEEEEDSQEDEEEDEDDDEKTPSQDEGETVSNDNIDSRDSTETDFVSPTDAIMKDDLSDVEMKDDTDRTNHSQADVVLKDGEIESLPKESETEGKMSPQHEDTSGCDIEMEDISSQEEDNIVNSTQDNVRDQETLQNDGSLDPSKNFGENNDSQGDSNFDDLSRTDGENKDSQGDSDFDGVSNPSQNDCKNNDSRDDSDFKDSSLEDGQIADSSQSDGADKNNKEIRDSSRDDSSAQDSSQDDGKEKTDVSLDYDESQDSSLELTNKDSALNDGEITDLSQENTDGDIVSDSHEIQDSSHKDIQNEGMPEVLQDEGTENKDIPQELDVREEDRNNDKSQGLFQGSLHADTNIEHYKDTSSDFNESKDSLQEDTTGKFASQEHLDSSLEDDINDSFDESRSKEPSPEYNVIKDVPKEDRINQVTCQESCSTKSNVDNTVTVIKEDIKVEEEIFPKEITENKDTINEDTKVKTDSSQSIKVEETPHVNGSSSVIAAGMKASPRKVGMAFGTAGEPCKPAAKPVESLRNMLEDIEEGELDYEEEGEVAEEEEELPDLPEYDPSAHKKANGYGSEEGEIFSETEQEEEEREDGEIRDDDETGQVYILVDPLNDKWKKVVQKDEQRKLDVEEGQLEEADETKRLPLPSPIPTTTNTGGAPRFFIPRTLCKYFNNGQCRWGATCRFLHPGVNDKGIPADLQPQWNSDPHLGSKTMSPPEILPQDQQPPPPQVVPMLTDNRGNYVMHRPPGMYPNAYGKAPPPMECINVPVMPAPTIVDMSYLPPGHAELLALPVGMVGERHPLIPMAPIIKESAWEKGLRRAKEIKEVATRRREEDQDFEQKRLSMRIPEHVIEKATDFEPGLDPQLSAEKALNEWGIRNRESRDFDRRHRGDDRRSERYGSMYADRFSRQPKGQIDRSSGRARLGALSPTHPVRREERQRQRERERRDREEKDKEVTEKDRLKIESIYKGERLVPEMVKPIADPRVARQQLGDATNTPIPVKVPKTVGATEWHDPWMRSQQPPSAQIKSEIQKQPGVEAISDSDSSSSDSDSDSDSSSTDKSSGSDSDSSSSSDGEPKKFAVAEAAIKNEPSEDIVIEDTKGGIPGSKTDPSDTSRKDRRPVRTADDKQPTKEKAEKTEPLSYEEWKRLQTMQKAQYHQQMANQYKTALESKGEVASVKKEISPIRVKEISRIPKGERPEEKKPSVFEAAKNAAAAAKRENQTTTVTPGGENTEKKPTNPRNEDRLDSPKKPEKKDTDSGSDSDSDSDSDSSSNSTSDDSDSDSESDAEVAAKLAAKSAPVDTTARKDIPAAVEKPKTEVEIASFAGKRPARKDELLKELKAVEDAIARKRAKID